MCYSIASLEPLGLPLPMSHSRLPRSVVRLLPLLLFLILFVGAPVRAELTVLASIKPLGLIVEEVMGERGQVDTLLQGSASPHNYAVRVSDMQRLQAADVVVWVGPEMETVLEVGRASCRER